MWEATKQHWVYNIPTKVCFFVVAILQRAQDQLRNRGQQVEIRHQQTSNWRVA